MVDSPYRAHHAFAFGLGGFGYVTTGTLQNGQSTSRMEVYDPSQNKWTSRQPFPGGARSFGIGDVSGGRAYFGFGVDVSGAFLKDLWRFDGSAWKRRASCPQHCEARIHPALVAQGGKIYVGAGYGRYSGDLNDFWAYDIQSNSWAQLAPINGPPVHHPFAFRAANGNGADRPHVLFGHGAQSISYTAHRYSPDSNSWKKTKRLPAQGRVAGKPAPRCPPHERNCRPGYAYAYG